MSACFSHLPVLTLNIRRSSLLKTQEPDANEFNIVILLFHSLAFAWVPSIVDKEKHRDSCRLVVKSLAPLVPISSTLKLCRHWARPV